MAIELKQSLKLSQQLVMTPQLQQAIKLLQLSRVELVDMVQTEMLENPVLEENQDNPDAAAEIPDKKETAEQNVTEVNPSEKEFNVADWENYFNEGSSSHSLPSTYEAPEDLPAYDATLTKATTLQDHLDWQLRMAEISEKEAEICTLIIGNIDDDGYFKSELDEIARKAECTIEEAEDSLARIQEFDPPGVGATDLKECLLIQTRHLEGSPLLATVRKVIKNHLDLLMKRNYPGLAKALGIGMERVKVVVKIISELEPKPGRPFGIDNAQYILPDVYVHKVGGDYAIVLNEDGMPKLRISSFYQSAMSNKTNPNTKEYIQGKIRSAIWLIKSIHQRQRTVYKTTESIVKFQREFFDKGIAYLKPMVLRDVAEDISMHESTISRVTTNKYVHTPHGIFELKFFFNSSISRTNKESLASEAVKSKIKQLIASENPKKPFSDQQIVEMLGQSGIEIARRTVAKYRESMGLLPSSKRKRLF